jgi:translation initiation factor IF-2
MVGGIEVQSEEPPPAPDLRVRDQPREIETFDGTLDFNAVAHDAARADGLEVQEEVRLSPQELPVEGLAHTQYESGLYAPPAETADDAFPKIDLPLIMPDEVSAPRPHAAPAAPPAPPAPAPVARAAAAAPAPAPAPPAPARSGRGIEHAPPAAVRLSDDDGAADTAALSRAEPVLTETMAELYLRQGHLDEALRVYQALLAQRPADARLRARVEALTPGGKQGQGDTGESLPDFLRRIMTARLDAAPEPAPPAPPSPPPPSAPSVASRAPAPAGESRSDVPGEATRPAGDAISLDEVFGDEGPQRAAPSAAPLAAATPPGPPAPPAPPAPVPEQTLGFSFDQFFSAMAPGGSGVPGAPAGAAGDAAARGGEGGGGGGSGGGAGREPGASPEALGARGAGRASGPKTRPQAEDEGDLDQFQAWLRGLKS